MDTNKAIEYLDMDLVRTLEGIIQRMDTTNKLLETIADRISWISGER